MFHAYPDGDAIGSGLGLYHLLESTHPDLQIACFDRIPEYLQWLPDAEKITTKPAWEGVERIFVLDCGSKHLTRFDESHPPILSNQYERINIDHHPTNEQWGDLNLIDTKASSTAEILTRIFREIKFPINPAVATCLLTGIMTDTGAFQHQNTQPDTFQAATQLIRAGANHNAISQHIFGNIPESTLRLWGKVLLNLHITADGAAVVGVKQSDYEQLGASRQDLSGVMDYLNSLPQAKYSVLLSEDNQGNVKASCGHDAMILMSKRSPNNLVAADTSKPLDLQFVADDSNPRLPGKSKEPIRKQARIKKI